MREVDEQRDSCAIVHFAYDIGPDEAQGLTPAQVAKT
jgi:hypothetical protein